MSDSKLDGIKELMEVVGSADVGLVIFDKQLTVRVWNLFMVKHSHKSAESVMGKNLFQLFPSFPEKIFLNKLEQCQSERKKVLSTWQELPYYFEFENIRKSSKSTQFMYQNLTFIPLASASGELENFAITINDVTDIAVSTKQLDEVVNDYTSGSQ